jgi:hypothetical protein
VPIARLDRVQRWLDRGLSYRAIGARLRPPISGERVGQLVQTHQLDRLKGLDARVSAMRSHPMRSIPADIVALILRLQAQGLSVTLPDWPSRRLVLAVNGSRILVRRCRTVQHRGPHAIAYHVARGSTLPARITHLAFLVTGGAYVLPRRLAVRRKTWYIPAGTAHRQPTLDFWATWKNAWPGKSAT